MELKVYVPVILSALMALLAVKWIYFKILKIALDKDLVDNPDARKLQKYPVPVMGGVAVFFGILVGSVVCNTTSGLLGFPLDPRLITVISVSGLMLYVGVMDDIMGLTPLSRIVIEVLALFGLIFSTGRCIDTFGGMWGIEYFSWWLGVPLTVFAGVGIINAVNMIDGVNGLSSGMCMTCSLFFGIVFFTLGDWFNAALAMTSVGALIPFFVHNVFGLKSRMFIGDAGTMLMGILMTWFLICVLGFEGGSIEYGRSMEFNMIAMGLAVLSVPVFDTLRVMVMRMVNGKSPFSADKTHLHHVFIHVGISHFVTAMCEIHICVLISLIWLVSALCGLSLDTQLYVVILASIFLVWGTYAFLRYHTSRQTPLLKRIVRFSPGTHLGRKEWWKKITAWLDAPEEYYIPKEK